AVQFLIDAIENVLGVVETQQQRTGTTLFLRRQQMVTARYRARAFTESLETEHLPTDRTDELFACSIPGAAEETTQDCCWSFRRDNCCHVTYSTPKMCRPRSGVRPQNISFLLLGVIRLDAERYQILSDALLLLRILGTQ